MNPSPTAEAIVQRQLDAYNARDIDALLDAYADDAQTFEHPATPIASGTAMLRDRFLARFAEQNLHATLLGRTVMGTTAIDHERVARTFPEGPGTLELIMIYEIRDGKIGKAWSIAGAKTLD